MSYNRRKFISFIGKASLSAIIAPQFLMSCGSNTSPTKEFNNNSKERLNTLKKSNFKRFRSI